MSVLDEIVDDAEYSLPGYWKPEALAEAKEELSKLRAEAEAGRLLQKQLYGFLCDNVPDFKGLIKCHDAYVKVIEKNDGFVPEEF